MYCSDGVDSGYDAQEIHVVPSGVTRAVLDVVRQIEFGKGVGSLGLYQREMLFVKGEQENNGKNLCTNILRVLESHTQSRNYSNTGLSPPETTNGILRCQNVEENAWVGPRWR